MKHKVWVVVLLCIATVLHAQKPLQTLVKENEKCVFLVECYNEKNQITSIGSGFFIDKSGIAFTNVHVLKNAFKAKIKTIDGKFHDIDRILDYNANLDIAKIKVKNANDVFHATVISKKKAEKGEPIFVIGNPDGLENTVSTGIVSSLRNYPEYGECYQITAPISPGSSGGALFNMDGEVIGITTFGQLDKNRLNQNLNFAVNIANAAYLTQKLDLSIEKASKEITYEDFIPTFMRLHLSGDFLGAIKVCTDQLNINPSNGLASHLRATSYMMLNQTASAERDFKNSLLFSSSNSIKEWDYIGLGKIFRSVGQFEKSRDNYLKALDINNSNPITWCNLAVLGEQWLGEDSRLVEPSYTTALNLDPTSCAFGYRKIGGKYLLQYEYDKAIHYLTLAINIEADKDVIINDYYNRGTCYYKKNLYDKAINDFKMCISIMPNDIQSYLWMGLAYLEKGSKSEACFCFNKASEINNSFERDEQTQDKISEYINSYCK
jgi:tetratricopeptide (TPR) repeat protein